MTPIGRPSTRMKAVMMPMPNFARSSRTEPLSAMVSMIARMSYSRSRFSGTACRRRRWSGASHADTVPWK